MANYREKWLYQKPKAYCWVPGPTHMQNKSKTLTLKKKLAASVSCIAQASGGKVGGMSDVHDPGPGRQECVSSIGLWPACCRGVGPEQAGRVQPGDAVQAQDLGGTDAGSLLCLPGTAGFFGLKHLQ